MSIEGAEYDNRALQSLAEADDYVLVTIKKDEEGRPKSDVFASSMIPVPFCIEVLREYFKSDGMNYGDTDDDDKF